MKQDEYTLACSRQLMRQGYTDVEVKTDQAVTAVNSEHSLVCFRCILTRWGRVGEIEVEEMIPLMRYYGADCGVILTNGRFTSGAKQRAKQEGNIALIPRYGGPSEHADDYDALL